MVGVAMRAAWPAGEVTEAAAAEAATSSGPKVVPPPSPQEVSNQAESPSQPRAAGGGGLPQHLAHVATPQHRGGHGYGGRGRHGAGGDAFHLGGGSRHSNNSDRHYYNSDRHQGSNSSNAGGSSTGCALEEVLRRKGIDEAWNFLEELQKQGALTDKYTVSRMLMKTMAEGRGKFQMARIYRCISIVEKFIDSQPNDVDEVLFNALLDTCCRLKDLPRLEQIVKRMRELKVIPSPVTLGILVKTYGQAGDLQKVLQVWDEMDKQRCQANAVTYGCMIDACVKCGHLQKAVEIFQGMRKEGKHKNTILYTTLIKGYGLDKDLGNAMRLFREMADQGVPYNTITYNSIIDACVKCSDLPTAEQLLKEMISSETQLEPDLITFSTVLKGYCYLGDLDKALQVAEAIKERGLRCDELVYNTLLDGCVKANDVAVGIGLFEEMVQFGMRPSTITHSILARLYQRLGTEEEAVEAVAQLYEFYGVERPVAGDRHGRGGFGRPGGKTSAHRSPGGYNHHARDDWWGYQPDNGWMHHGGHGGMQDMSAPPTPLGSPMGSQYGMSAPPTPMGSASPMASPMGSAYSGGVLGFGGADLTAAMQTMPGLPCGGHPGGAAHFGGMIAPRLGPASGPQGCMSPCGGGSMSCGSPHGSMPMPQCQYSRPQWSMPMGMQGAEGMTSPMGTMAMPAGPAVACGNSPMGAAEACCSMPLLSSPPPHPMATMAPPVGGESPQGIMGTAAPMTGPVCGGPCQAQAYFESWKPATA